MTHSPYTDLSNTQFWSSGVKSPVNDQRFLDIEPLSSSISTDSCIVSGGPCFAQNIGEELTIRGFDYLRSNLAGERIESFGLGNIYTITQLKQWLEFALGRREWSDDCCFEGDGQYYDLLLPHRLALSSKSEIELHRIAVKDEMVSYLKKADTFVFTLGLTETWRNTTGDIFPICPGMLVGEYDEAAHHFHNGEFTEIHTDLLAVEEMLVELNKALTLVLTVSPVPLTATASDEHILLATTYSKSVIRAAVGQFCYESARATYFPSFEIINHISKGDHRFDGNLRSTSASGVRYVMEHAFADELGKLISQ